MTAPDADWPEWMDLGKAECGWSNIAADEGNRQRYVRADLVAGLVKALEKVGKTYPGNSNALIYSDMQIRDISRAALERYRGGV